MCRGFKGVVFLFFLILLLAGTPLKHGCSQGDTAGQIAFRWAFVHHSPDSKKEIIDFAKRPEVSSGDKLQIYLRPESEVYLYLYLYDTHRDLYLLFPETPDYYKGMQLEEEEDIYIPSKYDWFEWDDSKGTERIYLLASSKRLTDLEEKTEKYISSNQDGKLKSQLYDTIVSLRKQRSNLTAPSEKPVAIAGTIRTRGSGSELAGKAILVEAESFYSKTLRLKHE